jgi:hypothetical protein
MRSVQGSGADIQAVQDGIASHACNSLTATYYLFLQKHRANRATLIKNSTETTILNSDQSQLSGDCCFVIYVYKFM